ncbi:MAG: winged helix-turn-helix domain-containing protein [Pseudomonadota bacterium]
MNDLTAANAFAALGHPSRVAILRLLVQAGGAGLTVSNMREALDIPATTFGHHLKAMADAKLIQQSRAGRALISVADFSALQSLIEFLMEDCCRGSLSPQTTLELETS